MGTAGVATMPAVAGAGYLFDPGFALVTSRDAVFGHARSAARSAELTHTDKIDRIAPHC
jgi:hypothetical protein